MKLQLSDLAELEPIERVTIHSIDWMIYQVSLTIDDQEKLLYQGQHPFRFHNLLQVRELFELLDVRRYRLLRNNSAYDEMIGQPEPLFSDTLEVELFWKKVEAGTLH